MCDVAERLEKMGIEKGLKQGIGEGIKQGIEQGIELGKTAGIHAEKVRVYKRLIKKGFSEKEAREIAELPETLNVYFLSHILKELPLRCFFTFMAALFNRFLFQNQCS